MRDCMPLKIKILTVKPSCVPSLHFKLDAWLVLCHWLLSKIIALKNQWKILIREYSYKVLTDTEEIPFTELNIKGQKTEKACRTKIDHRDLKERCFRKHSAKRDKKKPQLLTSTVDHRLIIHAIEETDTKAKSYLELKRFISRSRI